MIKLHSSMPSDGARKNWTGCKQAYPEYLDLDFLVVWWKRNVSFNHILAIWLLLVLVWFSWQKVKSTAVTISVYSKKEH